MRRAIRLLLLAVFMLGAVEAPVAGAEPAAGPAATGSAPTARAEPPGPAALAAAMKLVDEVYKDDLAKAVKPDDKVALAQKLLLAGVDTKNDPAGQYALLTKARDLAAAAGDAGVALRAVGELAQRFVMDGLKAQADLLVALAGRATRMPAALLDAAAKVEDDALAADRYDLAKQVAEAMMAAARRQPDPATLKQALARGAEVREIETAWTKAKAAFAKLAQDPADAPANLAAGRFLCFGKGDWPAGLPKLAAGSDAALKDLAAKEAKVADDAAAKLALADAWWDLAEKEQPLAKKHLLLHAGQWYQAAAPGLAGLSKAKAQRRAEDATTAAKGLVVAPGAGAGAGVPKRTSRIRVLNRTDAKEAEEIVDHVAARYPDVVKNLREVALVKYHDATELKRSGDAAKMEGSYSATPVTIGGGGISLFGLYEDWPAGKYVVIYRVLSKQELTGQNVCFLDVCKGGGTIAARHPDGSELEPGKWIAMPVVMELKGNTNVEYRLWPQNHTLAVDRIYIFVLP